MRPLLPVMCALTLAATVFLAVSYALKGLDDWQPLWRLLLVAGPAAATLAVLAWARPPVAVHWGTAALGVALVWVGWSAIDRTLSGSHFEGYALVLGMMAIAEGVLTAVVFVPRPTG